LSVTNHHSGKALQEKTLSLGIGVDDSNDDFALKGFFWKIYEKRT